MIKKIKINKNSFRFKIAFYYLVASLSVILIFSSVIYVVVSQIIVREAISKTEMAIQSSSNNIGELLRYQQNLLEFYSYDPSLQDLTFGNNQQESVVMEKITAIAKSDINILGVFLSLNNGISFTSSDIPFIATEHNLLTQIPCLTNERTGNYQHSDQWIVTITVPIKDNQNSEIGVLGVDLDYCIFSHTLENLNLGTKDLIFIKDSKDNLVFRSDKITTNVENAEILLSTTPENGYNAKTNTLIYSVLIPNTDWTMFSVVTPDGLNILKHQLFDMVILMTFLLSIAVIIISVVVSRNLTDPISRLVAGMEDIQELAELAIRKDEVSETAILTKSYNRMIIKIKGLMAELETKQEELRSAEFDVLTSQINPHFLYNTLDTIIWLAEFKDTTKIIKLTKSLASFFRLSLNGGRSVVTLADEIEHVKQYLFIQKERYGDKFDYSFAIDSNALDCMMPKILLQPLVENAIYHGIKPMDGNGLIIIEASIESSYLLIKVIDNGVGLNHTTSLPPTKKTLNGVGLKNIEKRIKLFFGESAELKVHSREPENGVEVILQCSL